MYSRKKILYRELLSRRARERFGKARTRFDILCGILGVTILIATVCCSGQAYELGNPHPAGFALWFLLILAYVPLEIVGLLNWSFGMSESCWMYFLTVEHQALGMGIFNIVMLLLIWGIIRFWLSGRYGIKLLQVSGTFVMIFLCWGVFQLLCLAGVTIWDRGGFAPLHRHLHRPEMPEKVILVDVAHPETVPLDVKTGDEN